MATRPQTIGYALLDSPVALAAWLLDHDTDSYYKTSRAFVDGEPVGSLTRDTILDNITLYNVITEVKEFEGPHMLPASPGWEKVADYALDWARDHSALPSTG